MGGPAARGHGGDGGAVIRGAFKLPEYNTILPAATVRVDSPLGSIGPGTRVPLRRFASLSPRF